jgi:hypothetical protein
MRILCKPRLSVVLTLSLSKGEGVLRELSVLMATEGDRSGPEDRPSKGYFGSITA